MEYNNGYYFVCDYDKDQSIIVYFRGHSGFIVNVLGDRIYTLYPNGEEEEIENSTEEVLDQYASDELIYLGEKKPILGKENVVQESEKPLTEDTNLEKSGLIVVGKTQIDNNKINELINDPNFSYFGEWNVKEGYFFFPEEEETIDALEKELDKEFGVKGINARFELNITEDYSQTTTMFSAVSENPTLSLKTEDTNKNNSLYKSFEEYTNPDRILITLTDDRKIEVWKKKIKGGAKAYQTLLQIFGDNKKELIDKIVNTLITTLPIKESSNPHENKGLLIVTNDFKHIVDTNSEPAKLIPLTKGMDLTNYIRDYNIFGTKKTIELLGKESEWSTIQVKYNFENYRTYDGNYITENLNEADETSNPIVDANKVIEKLELASNEQDVENALQYLPGLSSKKQKAIQWMLTDPKARKVLTDIDTKFNAGLLSTLEGLKESIFEGLTFNKNTMINKNTIKEGQGDQYAIETRKAIVKYPNNDLVQFFVDYVKKNFKDTIVYSIVENCDLYTLDLSFVVEGAQAQMQYNRENAKVKAYEIKRQIEGEMLKKFDIPSFSIQGLKLHKTKDKLICDFSISLIYSNHNNKQHFESVKKLTKILEDVTGKKVSLKENSTVQSYVEKFNMKMSNSSYQSAAYWVDGIGGISDAEKKQIWDAILPSINQSTKKVGEDLPSWLTELKELATSTNPNLDQMGHFYLDLIDEGKSTKEALELTAQHFSMNVEDLKAEFANNHITESLVKEEETKVPQIVTLKDEPSMDVKAGDYEVVFQGIKDGEETYDLKSISNPNLIISLTKDYVEGKGYWKNAGGVGVGKFTKKEEKEITTEVLGLKDEEGDERVAKIKQHDQELATKANVSIDTVEACLQGDEDPGNAEHVKFVNFLLANDAKELKAVAEFLNLTSDETIKSINYYKEAFSL